MIYNIVKPSWFRLEFHRNFFHDSFGSQDAYLNRWNPFNQVEVFIDILINFASRLTCLCIAHSGETMPHCMALTRNKRKFDDPIRLSPNLTETSHIRTWINLWNWVHKTLGSNLTGSTQYPLEIHKMHLLGGWNMEDRTPKLLGRLLHLHSFNKFILHSKERE